MGSVAKECEVREEWRASKRGEAVLQIVVRVLAPGHGEERWPVYKRGKFEKGTLNNEKVSNA